MPRNARAGSAYVATNAHRQTVAPYAAAIVDRLTFGGHIIETGTESFRLASTRAEQS